MMTTRYDILPPEVIQELSKLQENVPPFSSKVFMKVLERNLGDLDRHFEHISPEPHASASIAQVHRARLKDGREVVIKLRRPGIEKTVRDDIRTLKHLLYIIDKLPQFKHIDMTDIVEEFGRLYRDI